MYSGGYDDDDLTAAPITNGAKKTFWGGSNALANGDDDLAGDMEVWRPQEAKTQRKEVSFMIDDTLIEKKKPKVSLLANAKLNTEDIFTKDTEEDDLGPPTPPPEPEEPVEKQVVKNEEEERRKEKEQKKKEEKKREQKEREAREREIKKLRQMCEKLMDRLKDSTAKVTDLRHKNEDKEKKMEQLQKHLLLERQRANRKINNNDGFTLQLSDDTGVKKLTDDSDLVTGIEWHDAEFDLGELLKDQNLVWYKRLLAYLARYVRILQNFNHKYSPLRRDCESVEARYGGGIAAYFQFFRWQTLMGLWAALLVFGTHVPHFIFQGIQEDSIVWGDSIIPQFILFDSFCYTTFSPAGVFMYLGLLFVVITIWVLGLIYKTLSISKEQINHKIRNKDLENKKYAKLLFTCWDHSLRDSESVKDQVFNVVREMRVLLDETDRIQKSKTRSKFDTTILYIRRITSNTVIVVLILLATAGLVALSLEEQVISSNLKTIPGIGLVTGYLVPVAISVINFATPMAVIGLTAFEKWDNPGTYLKIITIRFYVLRTVMVILSLVNMLSLLHPSWFLSLNVVGNTTSATDVPMIQSINYADIRYIPISELLTNRMMDTSNATSVVLSQSKTTANTCAMNKSGVYLARLVIITLVSEFLDPMFLLFKFILTKIAAWVKKRQQKREKEKEEKAKEKELLSATTPEDSTGNATAPSPKHSSTTPVVETPVTAFTPKPDDDRIAKDKNAKPEKKKENAVVKWIMDHVKDFIFTPPEFDTPRRLVSLIYFQAVMWICLPFVPFVVFICAIANFLLFKYQKFFLFRLMKKPKQSFSAMDTNVFFILLYICTFMLALTTYYYMMYIEKFDEAKCSLVTSQNSLDSTVIGVLKSVMSKDSRVQMVYEHVLSNSVIVWLVVAVMFASYYSRDQTTKALRNYTNTLRERMTKEQKAYEDKMAKQKGEIAILQKKVNFLKHE